jgi:hypothetical protein
VLAAEGTAMHKLGLPNGITVSYKKCGSGPPLVLVHGGFSDHDSNWEFVLPLLEKEFTVYAVARRGRSKFRRSLLTERSVVRIAIVEPNIFYEFEALPVDCLRRRTRTNWPIQRDFESLGQFRERLNPLETAASGAIRFRFLSVSCRPRSFG